MRLSIYIFTLLVSVIGYAQQPLASVPFELFGDHIFIQLSVDNSEPVDFIFDTGDGLTVLDTDIAEELNLEPDHAEVKTSAQGSIKGSLIEHNTIEIGDVHLEEVELYTTSLNHLEMSIGRNIDGIIGYDLLKNYVVSIDYDDMLMKIYVPEGFSYQGKGQSMPVKLIHYIPTVTATVQLNNGETYKESFFVNTGAGTTMDFNTPFANKHKVIDKTGEHYSYPVAGLGKEETRHYEGRVSNFKIGSIDVQNLPIGISQATHGIQHNKKVAGIMGNRLLKHYNITFDLTNKVIYMDSNKVTDEPYTVNASGINLQYDTELKKVIIHQVYENSPASKVGLKTNSQLKSINGKNVSESTLPELREALEVEGKTTLTLSEDGGKEIVLDLKPLI